MRAGIKAPKVVSDIDDMLAFVAGESFLRREVEIFTGDRKMKLFNALWNKEYNYECDEKLTDDIRKCINYGNKIFNVTMWRDGKDFYALKDTSRQTVFIKYRLYTDGKGGR